MDFKSISRRLPLLASVLLALALHTVLSQTQGPQNLVFFNGTATVETNTIFSPEGQITLQFRTCTGGELFSQTNGDQTIAVSINETGSIRIRWNSGSGVMETAVGQGFNDNLWTIVDFVYVGNSVVLRVRDEAIELATFIKNPTLLDLALSPVMVLGTGFTGCMEEIVGIDFANAVSWSNARWGVCPLDQDIGCGPQSQDPCASQPCLNNGLCSSDGIGFTCQCTSRFNGTTCENDLGELCSNPSFAVDCINGACMEDGVSNTTFCRCTPGYGGPVCNTSSTLCDNNPCGASGECQTNAALDGIICHCSAEINDCEVNPCLNGGTCQDGINSFTCDCNGTGYSGTRCETNENECQNSPCQNGAGCSDTSGGYYCTCTAGNIGPNCADNLCSLTPCENGATCSVNEGDITCTCAGGFEGDRCQTDIDECTSQPCQNGGICIDKPNKFQCFCAADYIGSMCEIELNECIQDVINSCLNGATCMDLPVGHSCACVPGFTDDDCGTDIDECASSPCSNNATCVDQVNQFRCECAPGFNGIKCEINIDECASNPCQNGGVCTDEVNGYVCDCSDTGFDGPECTNNIDDCASNPCQNEGTCMDGIKFYNCSCYLGYEGVHCEIDMDECSPSPCQNGAICLQLSDQTLYQPGNPYSDYVPDVFSYANASGYVCVCPAGFEGVDCEVDIDECASGPCANGATCNDGMNRFDCECANGYNGDFCGNDIDECASDPCADGATCQDSVGAFFCRCPEGYGDTRCDVVLTACINNTQCLNEATCNPYYREGAHGFSCACPPGYTGQFCAEDTSASFFGTDQYLEYAFPSNLPFQFSLSFSTTIPSGHLLQSFSLGDSLTVEMVDGSLFVTSREDASVESVTITGLGSDLADGEWHDFEINLINSEPYSIEVNVTSDSCQNNICSETGTYHSPLSIFSSVYFGHVPSNYVGPITNNAYNGCMRDVKQTSSDHFIMATNPAVHAVSGCFRTFQCDPDPCNGQGECTDLWWTYTCQCRLGYTGPSCETSFVQGTFSFEDTTSYAMFDTSGYPLSKSENTIRLVFRTREEDGLLLYTGAGQDFIVLAIDNSSVIADVSFGGIAGSLRVSDSVFDGKYHSLEFIRQSTNMSLILDSSLPQTEVLASSSEPSFDQIFLGGVADFNAGGLPAAVSGSMYFKGCLWDVKHNNYSLEFFPLDIVDFQIDSIPVATNSNVISMCNSDNTCDPEPCESEGICSITWNDFECDCPNGYGGKNCVDIDKCASGPCANGATCNEGVNRFDCECANGYDGDFCGNDIDECAPSPCLNGATCQDSVGAFFCRCPEGYGDTRCDVVLTACIDNTECLNGATCSPYYREGAHGFSCICPPGYAGEFCTVDTSASFYGTDQYLEYAFPSALPFQFSFSFSTTIPSGHLLQSFSLGDSLTVEMVDGSLFVTSREDTSGESVTITGLGSDLDDGEWHDFEINLIDSEPGFIEANVTSDSCQNNICSETGTFNSALSTFSFVYFGHVPSNYVGPLTNNAYTGCMRDVKQTSSDDFIMATIPTVHAVSGCSRTLQCDPDPCNGQGECTDLWWTYTCQCRLGYTGPSCGTSAACSPLIFLNASFPDGREGDVVDSSETCPIYTTLGGTPIGRAECVQNTASGELAWNITMYLNDCGPLRETNEVVDEIIEKGVTNETVIEVLEVVIVVTDMELDERDIVNIANIISNSTALQSGDPEITTLTATIISNFAERDEDELSAVEENTGAITQILESFEEQLNNLDISDGQSYTALEMNVAVQVTSVEPVNFLSGLTVSASSTSSDLRQTDITLNDGDSIVQEEILTGTRVSIPSSVLNDLSSEDGSESGVRVALTVFSTPSLFASKHIRGTNAGQSSFNRTVNSLVIGLTLGRQKLVTLGENIVFKYTPLQSGFRDPECVFWDFEDTLDWSSRGCRKIPSSGSFQDSEITCSCDHLTNFAVLMDIYYERVEALRIISIIGCAISIVCLVIILITYLSNKNLHVHQSQKIFMCLCGTLLGLYLTFLIMSALDRHPDYSEVTPVPCGILAALVHFFTLSSMAWMGVEGINTYLIVVRVFDAYIPRFMLKASIVAWGVSGLIVLLTGLASQGNYAETDYCFLQKWPSVGGLLIPIAFILLANIVIFSLVVRRLIKSANVASNSDAAGTNRKASIERIKNAVSVLLLLGLTWVTGYLTLIDTTSQVTQTLFIVFNSLQGFFIFILYCARNPVVRAYWAKVCGCGQDSSRTSTRANQGTSQGISLTKTKSTSENDHDYENPSFDENKEYTDLDFSQGKKSGDPTKPTSSGKEYTGLDFSKIEKGGDPTKSFDGKEDVDPAYEVCII